MKTRLALAAVLPFAIACGGGGQSSEQTFRDAAPSASLLTVDVDAGTVPGTTTTAATSTVLPFPGDPCHPHLFMRTEALVGRLNRHVLKALSRVQRVMQHHPISQVGDSFVWVEDRSDEDVQFTITRTGDTTFTWELDVRPDGTTVGRRSSGEPSTAPAPPGRTRARATSPSTSPRSTPSSRPNPPPGRSPPRSTSARSPASWWSTPPE
jgi:hypothetical protein